LEGRGAEVMQAVPTMLELVPRGVNKWVGLQALLADLDLPREAVMAIGDGGNDLHIVANAGLGIAMGNAVPEVSAGLIPCSHVMRISS
jgi:HAD superfamily hydrolase (TIGR01484 family)